MVAEENVRLTVEQMINNSAVLKELADEGAIKVVGAMYDMDTGRVTMVSPRGTSNQ